MKKNGIRYAVAIIVGVVVGYLINTILGTEVTVVSVLRTLMVSAAAVAGSVYWVKRKQARRFQHKRNS